MKTFLCALALLTGSACAGEPWKFSLTDKEQRINVCVDLYEESIEVPGMELVGPLNGYLCGPGLYGTWMITSCKVKSEREAVVRASNDLGSETQEIRLVYTSDSTIVGTLVGTTVMKRVVGGRKLQKIEPTLTLHVNKAGE